MDSHEYNVFISIDGIEESLREFRESQQAEILGGVETIIENWFAKYNCISRKVKLYGIQ